MAEIDNTKVLNDFRTVERIQSIIPRYDLMMAFSTLIPVREVWEGSITDFVGDLMQKLSYDLREQ